jgi:hypothetical protein
MSVKPLRFFRSVGTNLRPRSNVGDAFLNSTAPVLNLSLLSVTAESHGYSPALLVGGAKLRIKVLPSRSNSFL